MKPFPNKPMTIAALIKHLQQFDPNGLIIADQWWPEDIRNVAEHLEKLTDEQCRVVMAYIQEMYSTEKGINNAVIMDAVDECIDQKLIEYNYNS